jgi:hypothetical protein
VIVVDGVPELGDARPLESVGAGCDAPLQLAAAARSVVDGKSAPDAAIANASAMVVTCPPRLRMVRVARTWLSWAWLIRRWSRT